MATLGAADNLSSKDGEGELIAKILAERKKKNAANDSIRLAKEKNISEIYENKDRLDSMVSANDKSWRSNVMNMDPSAKIIKKN